MSAQRTLNRPVNGPDPSTAMKCPTALTMKPAGNAGGARSWPGDIVTIDVAVVVIQSLQQ